MNIKIALTFLISIAWFGITFVYFLSVVRKNSEKEFNSWSLAKDINQLGKIHKKYLNIKRKNNPAAIGPRILIASNILCFLAHVGLFFTLLVRGVMIDMF